MSRPRTPTAILDARGAFSKDPQRARVDMQAEPLDPQPPPALTEPQKRAWQQLYARMPDGVLMHTDYASLYTLSCIWAEFVADPEALPVSKLAQMRAAYSDLGMSPAARAKLAVAPAKKGTGFEDV